MLRKIHGTNFFHIKFLGRTNNKCQNGLVLLPAQVFYFNGQALIDFIIRFILLYLHQSALGPRGGLWPVLVVGNT
jgi:hypothetical protein